MKRLLLAFAVLGLSLASAKTYRLNLSEPATVAGTELKAGDYKVEWKQETVVISNGRQSATASVKVEEADTKFGGTSLRLDNSNGKSRIQEIRLGGTRTKLILN